MNIIDQENQTQEEADAGVELVFVLEGKEPIADLNQLHAMAEAGKAVVCPKAPCFAHRIPAAFIINMQGAVIRRLFNAGMYVYQKKVAP